MIKIISKLYKIDYLYFLSYFEIKNIIVIISKDHKYLQKLTFQIFTDVTSHVELIPPPKCCHQKGGLTY